GAAWDRDRGAGSPPHRAAVQAAIRAVNRQRPAWLLAEKEPEDDDHHGPDPRGQGLPDAVSRADTGGHRRPVAIPAPGPLGVPQPARRGRYLTVCECKKRFWGRS